MSWKCGVCWLCVCVFVIMIWLSLRCFGCCIGRMLCIILCIVIVWVLCWMCLRWCLMVWCGGWKVCGLGGVCLCGCCLCLSCGWLCRFVSVWWWWCGCLDLCLIMCVCLVCLLICVCLYGGRWCVWWWVWLWCCGVCGVSRIVWCCCWVVWRWCWWSEMCDVGCGFGIMKGVWCGLVILFVICIYRW